MHHLKMILKVKWNWHSLYHPRINYVHILCLKTSPVNLSMYSDLKSKNNRNKGMGLSLGNPRYSICYKEKKNVSFLDFEVVLGVNQENIDLFESQLNLRHLIHIKCNIIPIHCQYWFCNICIGNKIAHNIWKRIKF